MNKSDIGRKVYPKDLEKNDMFYMTYGFDKRRFRVNEKLEDGIMAHSLKWLKSDAIFIPNAVREDIHYAGRMSKFRAWWRM